MILVRLYVSLRGEKARITTDTISSKKRAIKIIQWTITEMKHKEYSAGKLLSRNIFLSASGIFLFLSLASTPVSLKIVHQWFLLLQIHNLAMTLPYPSTTSIANSM